MDEPHSFDWAKSIAAATTVTRETLLIHHGPAGVGGSEAQKMESERGRLYAAKFANNPQGVRVLYNEYVTASLGATLQMPVPEVVVGIVGDELASTIRFTSGTAVYAGEASASAWLPDVRDYNKEVRYVDVPENTTRYTDLVALDNIVVNSDPQYLYATNQPYVVWSVDHGHVFPGGPAWTSASLAGYVFPGALANHPGVALDARRLAELCERLISLREEDIARIVGGPPAAWGVSLEERTNLGIFLCKSVRHIQSLISTPP